MSTILFTLGQLASRHPWRVVAVWLVASGSVCVLDTHIDTADGGQP